jgi:hypothetical protein
MSHECEVNAIQGRFVHRPQLGTSSKAKADKSRGYSLAPLLFFFGLRLAPLASEGSKGHSNPGNLLDNTKPCLHEYLLPRPKPADAPHSLSKHLPNRSSPSSLRSRSSPATQTSSPTCATTRAHTTSGYASVADLLQAMARRQEEGTMVRTRRARSSLGSRVVRRH